MLMSTEATLAWLGKLSGSGEPQLSLLLGWNNFARPLMSGSIVDIERFLERDGIHLPEAVHDQAIGLCDLAQMDLLTSEV